MVSSAGDKLLQDDAIQAYKDCLFPYSTIITPNRREADLLLGKSLTKDNMKEYIPELSKWGNCVIVKSIEDGDYLIDVFTTRSASASSCTRRHAYKPRT